jgi:hypothetical protein
MCKKKKRSGSLGWDQGGVCGFNGGDASVSSILALAYSFFVFLSSIVHSSCSCFTSYLIIL